MIYIALCHNRIPVQMPNGVTKSVGDMIVCPNSCPYRSSGRCSQMTEFKVMSPPKQIADEATAQKYRPMQYSQDEIREYFGSNSVPTPQFNAPTTQTISCGHENSDEAVSRVSTTTTADTIRKYGSFGKSRRDTNNTPTTHSEVLKSTGNYNSFEIGGELFSDDKEVKQKYHARPLKNAVWEVFNYWDTWAVFKSNHELREEFVWLVTTTSDFVIHKEEVDRILDNAEYTVSQKFFYIFYDVVFKRMRPKGFYWCDKKLSLDPLTAYFKDKHDFTVRYCNTDHAGVLFRNFYKARKKEILHYLNIENENCFFEEMTFDLVNEQGEIVCIDRYNDYMPIRLGGVETFVENMKRPAGLTTMRSMVAFLEKYRISCEGIVLRSSRHVFEKSARGNLQEDQSMYGALSLESSASYASEYDCYVTLLREYMRVFSPEEVKIGELRFTKANYSKEIEDVVRDMCRVLFGQVNDTVMEEKKSRAWLTKSLYERNILCTFSCENKNYIDRLMDLISNPTLTKYYTLFKSPTFQIGAKEYGIHDYLEMLMNHEDPYTICGEFRKNDIVCEYFNTKIQDPTQLNMEAIYKGYQKQYDDFVHR